MADQRYKPVDRNEVLRRPLLDPMKHQRTASSPHLERDSNPLSRAFLFFVHPLIEVAEKLDAQMEVEFLDLPLGDDLCVNASSKFERLWDEELEYQSKQAKLLKLPKPEPPRFLRLMARFVTTELILAQLFGALASAAPFISVVLLAEIQKFVSDPDRPLWVGAILAAIFFIAELLKALAQAQLGKLAARMELRLDAAVKSMILKRAINMSDEGLGKAGGPGAVYQMFAADVQRVGNTIPNTWRVVPDLVVQGTAAIIYLLVLIGWPALTVVVVLLIAFPVNNRIATRAMESFVKKMHAADARTTKIVEALNAVRAVKMYAWTNAFRGIVERLRAPEVEAIGLIMKWIALLMVSFGTVAPMIQVIVFLLLIYVTGEPSLVLFYQVLSLIGIVRSLTTQAPFIYLRYDQAMVAVDRLTLALTAEVRQDLPDVPGLEVGDIRMENASFLWPMPPPDQKKRRLRGVKPSDLAKEKPKSLTKLENIHFKASAGELVVIIGKVGSGKSSLVNAILGEMLFLKNDAEKEKSTEEMGPEPMNTTGDDTSSSTNVDAIKPPLYGLKGTVAYVPQQAWILNSTLRNNILLHLPMDEEKYNEVLVAADLVPDLKALPNGDLTEIGEKGINLSGGQKQRVSIARALYADADIYVFDDPLSALDAHVGKHVFEAAIMERLKTKTRVLVTHHMHTLTQANRVYVAEGLRITEEEVPKMDDLYPALTTSSDETPNPVSENSSSGPGTTGQTGKEVIRSMMKTFYSAQASAGSANNATPKTSKSNASPSSPSTGEKKKEEGKTLESKKAGQLTVKEERQSGHVNNATIFAYLSSFGGCGFWFAVFTAHSIVACVHLFATLWFAFWLERRWEFHTQYPEHFYIGVYAGAMFFDVLVILIRELLIWKPGAQRAPHVMYDRMFMSVMRAPLSFFDTTPVGRIITRFTKDAAQVDFQLPMATNILFMTGVGQIAAMIATCVAVPWSTPIFVVACVLLAFVQPTTATVVIRRIASAAAGPVFGLFSEALAGTSSIRSQGLTSFILARYVQVQDERNAAAYWDKVIFESVKVRISLLLALVAAGVMLVIMGTRDSLDTNLALFAIVNVMRISLTLGGLMMQKAAFMMSMNSVERMVDYSKLEEEVEGSDDPGSSWPSEGIIEFNEVQAQYRPELPLVLDGVSFKINSGEKVGVVGRTGSGKSSMILCLFRLLPMVGGSVTIDGVDTSTMPLDCLRGKIASIPQEPVLFQGSVRENLDATKATSDSELILALEHCKLLPILLKHEKTKRDAENEKKKKELGLKEASTSNEPIVEEEEEEENEVEMTTEKLHTAVLDMNLGVNDLSVGQKQLLCLARAVARDCKILVMDEATSSVDVITDAQIQETIRTVFVDATVITIAHRLNTIMDSDKVIVLDQAKLVEFDSPKNLLSDENSFFAQLAASSVDE